MQLTLVTLKGTCIACLYMLCVCVYNVYGVAGYVRTCIYMYLHVYILGGRGEFVHCACRYMCTYVTCTHVHVRMYMYMYT